MPYESNESLPKGVKGLPEGQQTKWRKVFNAAYEGTCKNSKDRDKCAARVAWSQISGKYKKSGALESFSMAVTHATHNKQQGTFRWKAVASDTDEDYFHDNMSMELFEDFISRIEINELAPENYRSTFWQGGMPYLSVSHYEDLEGKAVPGPVEKVFVDGNQLRAYGQFNKDKLGLACYATICKDLYEEPKPENPTRISIAFLDFGHIHKASGYEFVRENINDSCPECELEQIFGEYGGKIFKKGQLVHLALTRVPANERTSMEVEKSMTTRKEDAASIIGEELADEIDEKSKLIGKSQAMVIKSEEEEATEEVVEEPVEEVEQVPELVEEAKSKKKDDMKDEEMEDEEEEDYKKKKEKKSLTDERLDRIEKALVELSQAKVAPVLPHELDPIIAQFKSDYDQVKSLEGTSAEKLQLLQDSFNGFAETIRANFEEKVVEPVSTDQSEDHLVQALSKALENSFRPIAEKIDLFVAQQNKNVVQSSPAIPVRRSIPPRPDMQKDIRNPVAPSQPQSETPKLRAILNQNFDRARGIQ